jgi:hypothetical protein
MSVVGKPDYLIGRDVSALQVQPATKAVDGTFTFSTGYDLVPLKRFGGIRITGDPELEQIMATTSTVDNQVILFDSFEVEVTELLTADGDSTLWAVFGLYDYWRLQASLMIPGTSVTNVLAAVCVRAGIEGPTLENGRNVATLRGRPCGVPLYFGAPPSPI